jgi:hypothetical protein
LRLRYYWLPLLGRSRNTAFGTAALQYCVASARNAEKMLIFLQSIQKKYKKAYSSDQQYEKIANPKHFLITSTKYVESNDIATVE